MDSMHRGLTAHLRFWVVVFALVSLGIMAGGLKYYQYEQDHIRREKYQDLAAIADLKVRQILEWRRERLDDARSMARDPFLGKAIAEWLRDPGNPGLRAALLGRLKMEKEGGAYGNVLLTDPDGRLLLSVRPDPAPLSSAGKQALEAAVASRQAVVGDLFRCPKDDRVHLDVAASVLDLWGRPLAVVVLRTNADEVLYPLIQSWPTPSLTAETLLVKVEGMDVLFLNELRHRKKTALSLREPLTQKDLPAVQASLGKQGGFEGRDYRGKKVVADLRPVPQSPWFMVAKVDADEILAEARYRSGITGLFVVIFILLTGAVIAYGYRQRQANLCQDLYQAEREQRQAQEEFRTTLYSIADAVITTDTEGLVKHINPEAERLTGWLEVEARGKPLEEVFRIINEETRTAVENPTQRVLCEGVAVGLANHTLLIARDGIEFPIADSGAPIRDDNGAVSGMVLVFRDQTEERAAQNTLRESEERYRSLFDNMLNGFAYCKMLFEQNQPQDFIYLDVNASFEKVTGLKNVVGKRVSEVIPGIRASDPELIEIYGRVALTGKPERFEVYVEALKAWFSISVYSPQKERFVAVFDVITDRKRAEEALRQAEEKYRSIFENAVEGIFQSTPEGHYINANPAMARIFGYDSPEELMTETTDIKTQIYVDPQRRVEFQYLMDRDGFVKNFEYQIYRKDGGDLWISENARTVRDAEGDILYYEGFLQDISERKEAKTELMRLRCHQELILNSAWEGILGLDLDGRITFVNPAAASLVGYQVAELLGHNSHSIWHHSKPDGSFFSAKECPIYTALKKGESHWGTDEVFLRKDGTSFSVQYSIAPIIELGEVIGGVLTFCDISQQKEDRALTQSLITRSPVGIYLLQDGKFALTNPWFHNITGYNEKDLSNLHFWDLVHPDDREAVRTNALRMLREERLIPYEYRNITKGGKIKWIMETVTPIRYKGKRATLGYFMDITEHKQLEEQFLHAQKMEAVGRLAGGVAHDLNNMLGAIMGYAAMIKMTLQEGDECLDHVQGIKDAADRAASLTRQLLAFSRKQVTRPEVISVNKVVSEVEKMMRNIIGEDIELSIDLGPSLGAVKADPGQIAQIIMNLAVNARDSMPDGGKLTIETANVFLNQAHVSKHPEILPGPYVRLKVSDTGTGIDEETIPHIFEPFFTTKSVGKGTGLGLSTVFGIVQQNGGVIEVASECGLGTVFKTYFPQVQEELKPSAETSVIPTLRGSETILLVEDEDLMRKLIKAILEIHGYKVMSACDGGEALLLNEHHKGSIDLLVADVVMPQMSGRELAERLAPLRREMKVLYISGYTEDAPGLKGLIDEATPFLQKPFPPIDLVRRVRQVLDLKARITEN